MPTARQFAEDLALMQAAKQRLADDFRIKAVKAHALEHYNESGWDIVIEAMDNDEIYAVVMKARSIPGAIKRMAEHVEPIADRRSEIVGA